MVAKAWLLSNNQTFSSKPHAWEIHSPVYSKLKQRNTKKVFSQLLTLWSLRGHLTCGIIWKTIHVVLHNGIGCFPLLWASQLHREEDPPALTSFPTLSVQFLCCVLLQKDLQGGNLERWMGKQANHHFLVFPNTLESEGLWPRIENFYNLLGVKIWNKVSQRKELEETWIDPWPIKFGNK